MLAVGAGDVVTPRFALHGVVVAPSTKVNDMDELDQALGSIQARKSMAKQEPDDNLRSFLTSFIESQADALRRLKDAREPKA